MKNRIKILYALLGSLLFIGCSSDTPAPKPSLADICGEWQLVSASAGSEFTEGAYLGIDADATFQWYIDAAPYGYTQRPGELTTVVVGQSIEIAGAYSDGQAWEHTYTTTEITEESMIWTTESGSESLVFTRTAIPAAAKIPCAQLTDICGEWKLTEWSGDGEFVKEVYLRLRENRRFELYQNIVTNGFEMKDGSFTYEILGSAIAIRGNYSDGIAWTASYLITDIGDETMTWTADGIDDRCVYTRTTIPDNILDGTVRSGESGFRFL